jgi:hypothetical protein
LNGEKSIRLRKSVITKGTEKKTITDKNEPPIIGSNFIVSAIPNIIGNAINATTKHGKATNKPLIHNQ